MDIEWEVERVAGGGESIVAKMARKLLSDEAAIQTWAPALLKMELDRVLWKDSDHIQIKQLWEYLCSYCYLPRLSGYDVLEDAIKRGLGSREYLVSPPGTRTDAIRSSRSAMQRRLSIPATS